MGGGAEVPFKIREKNGNLQVILDSISSPPTKPTIHIHKPFLYFYGTFKCAWRKYFCYTKAETRHGHCTPLTSPKLTTKLEANTETYQYPNQANYFFHPDSNKYLPVITQDYCTIRLTMLGIGPEEFWLEDNLVDGTPKHVLMNLQLQ